MNGNGTACGFADLACAYALGALPANEWASAEAHIASCAMCRREVEAIQPTVESLVARPVDVLRPAPSLQVRLAARIAEEDGVPFVPAPPRNWTEPPWEEVAPGIECKLLSSDTENNRISMQVRLAPGASYPPHTHAGVEELHLLDGELWINGRKLFPGDYNYGEPHAEDWSVWSETGCTCVLITSTQDELR